MRRIACPDALQEQMLALRSQGKSIALVPTMGYLHAGHISLLQLARQRAEVVVMSLFVNPTQFAPGEDLDSYPRDEEGDASKAEEAGVDVLFCPTSEAMYPQGFDTQIRVPNLSMPLCGQSRPEHFGGVATVVCKLLNACQPTMAVFGQKDAQQLAVIRRMVRDLHLPVEIIGGPIVRESDGLAMSSRNVYLSAEDRQQATCLFRALQSVRSAYDKGERDVSVLRELAESEVATAPNASIDYIDIRDASSLQAISTIDSAALVALAVRFGKTRLIDNTILGE